MAYTDTPNLPLHMPTPGTREPAAISLLNENCVVLSNHDHTSGKGLAMGRLRSGLQASRPAAGSAGNVYFATDTGQFYVDTGTAWASFLTSGGAATVTGWTLVDPVIRDTLQFGPEGSGTIDATLSRTAAGALRVDTHLGVGVSPEAWLAGYPALRLGREGTLTAGAATKQALFGQNMRFDPGGFATPITASAPAVRVELNDGFFGVQTAPAVGAGAAQTFTTRAAINPTGTLTLTPDAGQYAIDAKAAVNVASPAGGWVFNATVNGVQKARIDQLGTLTLNPDAGARAIEVSGAISNPAANLVIRAQTGAVVPDGDGGQNLGNPSIRWGTVYAVTGTIQTSSLDMKENVRPLDPAAALEAVRSTGVILFNYKAPPPPDPVEGAEPLSPPAAPFEHAGYDAATTDPLLVMDDQSVNAQNTASVLLAAVQELLRRVVALEARDATAA